MAAPPFKTRLANHKTDFKYTGKRKHTRLAGYVWQLKDEGLDYNIEWQFLARAPTFKASPVWAYLNFFRQGVETQGEGLNPWTGKVKGEDKPSRYTGGAVCSELSWQRIVL